MPDDYLNAPEDEGSFDSSSELQDADAAPSSDDSWADLTDDDSSIAAALLQDDDLDEMELPTAEDGAASHVVGIGASAGGLEALERFFRAMPDSSNMAFVIVQHLSPDFKSLMDELLERYTSMPIRQVTGDLKIRPNNIYLLPPGGELTVNNDVLSMRPRTKDGGLFLPINLFFHSLASAWGERAVGIVLSGTGSDGTNGVLDIRDAGGVVLAETPESARFSSMPQSVINTGCADAILPPEEMPRFLVKYASAPEALRELEAMYADEPKQVGMPAILELLRKAYRIDFNHYKPRTITRRVERRVVANAHGGGSTLEEYCKQLETDPGALNQLYKDLLIGVTRFFRDAEAFEILKTKVVPDLLTRVAPNEEIRIWDCGCSTGEEAYSIAILFLEAFAEANMEPRLKVLATDLHGESLQIAGVGIYREEAFLDMPDYLKERYFEPLGDGRLKVLPHLRKVLIFSRHNLLNDPPFTHMHLVSCRNLLIYLRTAAQARAIASFHYSLVMNGVLFLGASESLGELMREFDTIDRQWKFFKKISDNRQVSDLRVGLSETPIRIDKPVSPSRASPLMSVYDALLNDFIPAGILLNGSGEIAHIFGNAKRYIRLEEGRFSGVATDLLHKSLQLPLSAGMRKAEKIGARVKLQGLKLLMDEQVEIVTMEIIPISQRGTDNNFFMIVIEKEEAAPATLEIPSQADIAFDIDSHAGEYVRDLEAELNRTREALQSTVEELETSNEELQASNEELLASNEELQSTNEELHSVNEELYSVNAEHELKIEELNRLSSDLRNLIQSTDTATIFVDSNMHIRLFTPKAREIFSLMQQDLGRDLRHFRPNVPDELLVADVESVASTGTRVGRHLPGLNGQSFLRRCAPYADPTGDSSGVVINYMDTTQVTRSIRALEESDERFERLLNMLPTPILVIDQNGVVTLGNVAAEHIFGHASGTLYGMSIDRLLVDASDLINEMITAHVEADDSSMDDKRAVTFEAIDVDSKSFEVKGLLTTLVIDGRTSAILTIFAGAEHEAQEHLTGAER